MLKKSLKCDWSASKECACNGSVCVKCLSLLQAMVLFGMLLVVSVVNQHFCFEKLVMLGTLGTGFLALKCLCESCSYATAGKSEPSDVLIFLTAESSVHRRRVYSSISERKEKNRKK